MEQQQWKRRIEMTCRELIEFLSDYAEDALPASTRVEFDEHLKECSACRRYLDQFKKTVEVTRDVAVNEDSLPPLPPELVDAIVKASRKD